MGDEKAFWSSEETIGIVKSGNKDIAIKKVSKNGKNYIDIRQFYAYHGDEEKRPGKGIAIPEEVFSQIRDIINEINISNNTL